VSKTIVVRGGGFGGLHVPAGLEKCQAANPGFEVFCIRKTPAGRAFKKRG
jgi:NADH dehydrogenase FAD-containing subunit